MTAIRSLFVCALLVACAAPVGLPVVRGPRPLSEPGQGSPSAQYQSTPCQRVGERIYCVYLVASTPDDPQDADQAAHYVVRELDVATLEPRGPARRVFAIEQDTLSAPVHSNPSLTRDRNGALIVTTFWLDRRLPDRLLNAALPCVRNPRSPSGPRCWGTQYRVIPDFGAPETWQPEGGIPARFFNTSAWSACPACGGGAHDWTWLYDERAGCAYGVAESQRANGQRWDGTQPGSGLGRLFYRVCGDATDPASFDGPYLIVDAGSWPSVRLGTPPSLAYGNVFTKGYLRLGREPAGARSLHLAWTNHNTFVIENRPGDGPCGTRGSDDDAVRWDFDLRYARSDDGGRTWQSWDGRARRSRTERIDWNDPRYRLWEGETEQTQGYAWDVDLDGHPVFALLETRGGVYKGDRRDPARWHIDQDLCNGERRDPAPARDLYLLRHDAAAGGWRRTLVERDYDEGRLGLHVALGGEIYLFRESPPRYRVSSDDGRSWSDWQRFDDFGCRSAGGPGCERGWRLQVMPDYDDPRFVLIAFQSPGRRRNPSRAESVTIDGRYHLVRLQTAR